MTVLEHTYLPAELDDALAEVLGSDAAGVHSRLYLAQDDARRVMLPEPLSSVLRQVVEAMREGLAVTVRPETQTLTTSQVAQLLGVTRPTVVHLLESGAIPYTRVGTHRRVTLPDALAYRDSRRENQYQFLADTGRDDESPRDVVLADLKRVRQELRTRAAQSSHA